MGTASVSPSAVAIPIVPPGYTLDELEYGFNQIWLQVEENGANPYCHEYNDIPLILWSECEANGDTYQNDPYQYLTEQGGEHGALTVVHPVWTGDEFDEDTLPIGIAGDEATFSVSWLEPTTAESELDVQTASASILVLVVLCALLAFSALVYYIYRARRDSHAHSKRAVREVELPTTTANPMSPHATNPVRTLAAAPKQMIEASAVL